MASLVKPQMQCHSNLQFPDSRPRACSHRSLFVRRTATRPCAKGQEPHFTQRLVRSVRCGSRVRQRTLRNLGRHFALPRGDWPALCARVERILGPPALPRFGACCPAVEDEAQRSAAQLVQAGVSPVDPSAALPRVDVDSLELVRPRSVGVERVALWAMRQLRPPSLLEELGLSRAQRAADLFDLQPTVTLHDRTSTCCEGAADRQPLEGSRATHPGVHGLRANSVGWDAERLWRTCVTRTDLEAVLRSLGSALGLRPIHHRKPVRSAGRLCLSVLACPLDDAAPSPGGPAAGDRGLPPGGRTRAARAQGDAGRVLTAGDPRAAGRGRLAGRGPQAGRPAQTTQGKCTEWSAHTPDSAAAMCSLQTTDAMGWQTGAGGLDCGCEIAGKQCLESLA